MINTNDILKTTGGKFRCIAKSKDTAVLAPFVQHKNGGGKTHYKNMLAVHPKGMGFEFEKIGRLKAA